MKINDRRGQNNGARPLITQRLPTDADVYVTLQWLYALERTQLARVKAQFALDYMTKNPPEPETP